MIPLDPETMEGITTLRNAHPAFGKVANLLLELAGDRDVSPELYLRICDSVFTVLNAWADQKNELDKLREEDW